MTRTIRAYGKTTRYPMSLSNYIYTGQGTVADTMEFKRIINNQPFDADKIVQALNNHSKTICKFRTYKQLDGGIQILAIDYCGNEDVISIHEGY